MELYLIRHPEPDVAPGVCYGRSDVGLLGALSPVVARLRAELPAGLSVYTSPLARCRALAEQLSSSAKIDDRLVEMNFGAWELRRWDEIERDAVAAWRADLLDYAPPGGETAGAMQSRALAFVEELLAAGEEAVAVITHGGVLCALFAHWLEVPPRQWLRLAFDFAGVSKVVLGRDGAEIHYLNR